MGRKQPPPSLGKRKVRQRRPGSGPCVDYLFRSSRVFEWFSNVAPLAPLKLDVEIFSDLLLNFSVFLFRQLPRRRYTSALRLARRPCGIITCIKKQQTKTRRYVSSFMPCQQDHTANLRPPGSMPLAPWTMWLGPASPGVGLHPPLHAKTARSEYLPSRTGSRHVSQHRSLQRQDQTASLMTANVLS